ncbi:MAG: hypothetical protein KDB24_15760 [Microthrixaceae bacterium]|nr:hypothetical protein [Microthrixaceae bacterium]
MTDVDDQGAQQSDDDPPAEQPFEVDAPNAYKWTKAAFKLLQAGELSAHVRTDHEVHSAVVNGACPRCCHDVGFTQVLDAVTGESMTTLGNRPAAAVDEYELLTVECRCVAEHPGRPKGIDHGCGINFRVDVLRSGP